MLHLRAQDDVSEAKWFAPSEVPSNLAFASTREQVQMWAAAITGDRLPPY